MQSYWRVLGHVGVFLAVAIIGTVLIDLGWRFLGDIFPGLAPKPQAAVVFSFVIALIVAIFATVWRVRRQPMRPLWFALLIFAVLLVVVSGYGSFVSANKDEAARTRPADGIYVCGNQIVVSITNGDTIRVPRTELDSPVSFTYDPLTHIVMPTGSAPSFQLRYVPKDQSGQNPDWTGPGIEFTTVISVLGEHDQSSANWCPLDPNMSIGG
jgi:hypothetical protein